MGYDDQMNEKDDDITHLALVSEPEKKRVILPNSVIRHGQPRIHGELLKLGFDVSEGSVSRCIRRAPRDPDFMKRWFTFLRNHREAIAAMDFFTVPTLTFGVRRIYGSRMSAYRED